MASRSHQTADHSFHGVGFGQDPARPLGQFRAAKKINRPISRQRPAGLALLVLSVLVMGAASASQSQEWNFKVFLDDRPIGYHRFRVSDRGTDQIIETEARFKVKALFIPLYSYHHQNTEVWEGNCLKEITSRTDDNGEEFQISGSRGEQQFRIAAQDRRAALPLCVMTFAYWNPNFLWEERLLNSQTGDYQTVEVTPMGVDTIVVAGKSVRANYYRLTADKLHITLWYSQDNRWLALESTTEGGRKLRYQLDRS